MAENMSLWLQGYHEGQRARICQLPIGHKACTTKNDLFLCNYSFLIIGNSRRNGFIGPRIWILFCNMTYHLNIHALIQDILYAITFLQLPDVIGISPFVQKRIFSWSFNVSSSIKRNMVFQVHSSNQSFWLHKNKVIIPIPVFFSYPPRLIRYP